ncbi:hypothetical protein Aco03nite_037000 [Actinoplanes couchii]|uniref:PKD domain-containing protein n=1 Tax=Actinoplanes couchii TaxID=403638 RepID=A0ABQ3X9Z3_9ACTN|nr:hypothetical protein Aco03nite_037000 [Actinoplanes couchii]
MEPSGSASVEPSVPVPSDSVSSSPTPSQSPVKDTKGPTKANFKLNYSSIWLGQVVTFTQTAADLADPTDATSKLSRVINWGDGTTSPLAASTTTVRKTYTKKGSFKVVVTVKDPAGNALVTPAKTVAVTTATGTVTLSKKNLYQGELFTVTTKTIPAGATHFRIDWSDGWPSVHKAKKGAAIRGHVIYQWKWDAVQKRYVPVNGSKVTGKRIIKVSWYNAKGYSVNQNVGTVSLAKDSWKPTLTITKPSPANKASSWRTIKGTATDKGAGVRFVYMTVLRVTADGKTYCLNGKKQWKRYYSGADQERLCLRSSVALWTKVVKGKWSVKVPAGSKKNQGVLAYAWAWDDAENFRSKTREAWLTRN